MQLADNEKPPVRLQLGSDTIQRVREKHRFVEQEMAQWLELAMSTDHDDVAQRAE